MKRVGTIILFSAFLGHVGAQGLQATLDYKMFYAPGKGNFVEVYASFNPFSCELLKMNDGQQASVEVLYIVRKEERIVDYRKKNITSPVYSDSVFVDFIDQDRLMVEEGTHELEIQFTDLNKNPKSPVRTFFKFDAEDLSKRVHVSGIQLIEQYTKATDPGPYTKSGYNLLPYIYTYYPADMVKIAWYAEVYMSEVARKKNETLVLFQYVENATTGVQVENMGKMQKLTPQEVTTCLGAFDIALLPTGDYNLIIEVKNKDKEIVSKRVQAFQRANDITALTEDYVAKSTITGTFVEHITNEDTLNDFIACLRPIGSNNEIALIDKYAKSDDVLSKKQFMYSFWLSRNSTAPESEWLKYKIEVKKVNAAFSTRIKRGYDTERGRVYLKYGPPNQIIDRPNEPSAYPYQIWHYYKAGNFSNKRFVFYNPDLVSNDYDLLHSDVFGEYKNYRWEYVLHSRNSTNTNIDNPGGDNIDHYGGQSKDLYRFPR